jgi:sugar lactone lactonase YvrE/tetratricopeptide (TPR) repeat protein
MSVTTKIINIGNQIRTKTMRLRIFNSKFLTVFTLCLFIFLLTSEAYSLRGFQETESFAKLLGEGEAFYKNKDYDKAIIRYLEAYMQATDDSEKADVFMGLALAYTGNDQKDKAQDYLLRLLQIQPDKKIEEKNYPADFVILFYQAKIEVLKPAAEPAKPTPTEVIKKEETKAPPKTEAAKKPEPKPATVEKKTTTPTAAKKAEPKTATKTDPKKQPAKEKKTEDLPDKLKDVPGVTATKKEDVVRKEDVAKKEEKSSSKDEKSATKDEPKEPVVKQQAAPEGRIEEKKKIPWLLIAGVAVIGGALAYLLLGGSESSEQEASAGSIQVNSSPAGAQILLDGSDTGQVTNTTLTGISPGSHEVEVSKEGYVDYKDNVTVTSGQTARVDASLSKHTISVTSPKANDVWHKGQNVQIKWNTGGGSSVVKSATQSHFNQLLSDSGNNRAFLRLKVYREREAMRARSHSMRAGGGGAEKSDELARVRKVIGELSQPARERTPGATGQTLDGAGNPGNNPGVLNILPQTQPGNDKAAAAGDLSIQAVSEIKIELLQGGKSVKVIANRTQNDGVHNWKVPVDVPDGFNFKVKVSAADESSVSGTSKVFTVTSEYELALKWGSRGKAQDQFNQPYGIAVGNSKVYIVEDINSRISIYTQQGTFLNMWGSPGKNIDQFQGPLGVAVAKNGTIYMADTNNERIMVFKPDGTFVREWGKRGGGNAQFRSPTGIAIDNNDNIYVADSYNFRIQKFNATGKFLTKWGSRGTGNDQFGLPVGVTVDNSGNVYVVDSENHRVMKFNSNGNFITKWGSHGNGDDRFNNPVGVACDSGGNVYVTDSKNHRFMKFDSTGKLITKLGTRGDGDDQFQYPSGIAVDASGKVYISDSGNYRIMKFKIVG